MTYKDGREQKFFLGFDSRSQRPVAISEGALKARFIDEQGHSKINHELFGKGTKTGEAFGTAISFNVARGEIAEDHSAKGQEIRSAAYEYLKKNNPQQKEAAQKEAAQKEEAVKAKTGQKTTPKKAPKL